jgi:type III secretion system (T3SS) SseB-like protein
MWSKLRSFFGGPPAVLNDERPPEDTEAFLRYLSKHGVLLVASKLDDDGMTLVVHRRSDGREVNPYFSTVGSVQKWVAQQQFTEVTPFPSLRIRPSWLVETGMRGEPTLLFDPASPWERDVTPDQFALLAKYVEEEEA